MSVLGFESRFPYPPVCSLTGNSYKMKSKETKSCWYNTMYLIALKFAKKVAQLIVCYKYISYYYFLWFCSPALSMASSTRFRDHTQRRATVGRTPLDEWSARRRDLFLIIHNTNKRQTSMPPVGFFLLFTISAYTIKCTISRLQYDRKHTLATPVLALHYESLIPRSWMRVFRVFQYNLHVYGSLWYNKVPLLHALFSNHYQVVSHPFFSGSIRHQFPSLSSQEVH
jgi:hypothetical protein